MQEIAERYADGEVTLARRRLGRLRRLALQRAAVEHRAAAAPEPRGLHPGGDGGPHRGSPGADPLVSEPLTADAALAPRRRRGHPPAADPDPVRGRARQHLPDRGRPADARRLGARTPGARSTSCSTSSPSTATRSTTSSWSCSRTSTSTTSAWSTSSSRHSGAEVAAIDKLAHFAEHYGEDAARDDEFAGGGDAAQRHPRGDRAGAADGLLGVPRAGARRRRSPARCATARRSSCATASCEVLHRPGPLARRTPSSGTRSAGS